MTDYTWILTEGLKTLPGGERILAAYNAATEGLVPAPGVIAQCGDVTAHGRTREEAVAKLKASQDLARCLPENCRGEPGWKPWFGGERPTAHPRASVQVQLRDGTRIGPVPAEMFNWSHRDGGGDVVAYRFPAVADGGEQIGWGK